MPYLLFSNYKLTELDIRDNIINETNYSIKFHHTKLSQHTELQPNGLHDTPTGNNRHNNNHNDIY